MQHDFSDEVLGGRYRLLSGVLRPYLAAGAPAFLYDHDELSGGRITGTTRKLAVGVRLGGGLEVKINGHLSVQGDVGYEHFFGVDERFETDLIVPTVGVIGRL